MQASPRHVPICSRKADPGSVAPEQHHPFDHCFSFSEQLLDFISSAGFHAAPGASQQPHYAASLFLGRVTRGWPFQIKSRTASDFLVSIKYFYWGRSSPGLCSDQSISAVFAAVPPVVMCTQIPKILGCS